MRNIVRRILEWGARQHIVVRLARAIVWRADERGAEVESGVALPEFTRDNGRVIALRPGYRDKVAPHWRSMASVAGESIAARRSPALDGAAVARTRYSIDTTVRFLASFGVDLEGKRVLEIGCGSGAHACALAEAGARQVVGIDVPEYTVLSLAVADPESGVSDVIEENRTNDCEVARQAFDPQGVWPEDRVQLRILDAHDLNASEEYDLVISWQTLEHLVDVRRALGNMSAALRPGGVMFHEYNPFCCESGGHSLCTLDFPFGHVRLTGAEFVRYVNTLRPRESTAAINFYTRCLNRMSLSDLRCYSKGAGLEILECLCWPTERGAVGPDILRECQSNYPSLTLTDLMSTKVWFVARKPA